MKIELGGGNKPRGDGYLNLDVLSCADMQHDLRKLPWPLADESVESLYSSHCLEHLDYRTSGDFGLKEVVREIARVCKVGADVEIRVPDAASEMAMCPGHLAVISINCFRHLDHIFPDQFWKDQPRRLRLIRIEPGPDDYWFPMARKSDLFSRWTDDEIMTWIPRTRHENRFYLTVEKC